MASRPRSRAAAPRVVRLCVALGVGLTLLAGPGASGVAAVAHAATVARAFGSGPVVHARASEPVVINGRDIPGWSRLAATGVAAPYPSGVTNAYGGDNVRSAHNGVITVPPDTRTGVDPDQIAAYRFDGSCVDRGPGAGRPDVPRLPRQRPLVVQRVLRHRPGAHLRVEPHGSLGGGGVVEEGVRRDHGDHQPRVHRSQLAVRRALPATGRIRPDRAGPGDRRWRRLPAQVAGRRR